MRVPGWDLTAFAWKAVVSHRLRSVLSMLGIAIGIAVITIMTSLGTGVRAQMVLAFADFGTNVLQIRPGRQPFGAAVPAAASGSTRPLRVSDTNLIRRVPGVQRATPCVIGTARAEVDTQARNVIVHGCGADLPEIWRFPVGQGRFFPTGDDERGGPLIVLGADLERTLFGASNPLGRYVNLNGQRFQVIGVMAWKGNFLGLDLDEAAYIPVATAQRLFARNDLNRIDVSFSETVRAEGLKERVRQTLMGSRRGSDDFTIGTQGEMLDTLDRILAVLTGMLAGIAGISLVVGATGIVTVMWISVSERRSEIGLIRALGSTPGQVLAMVLTEAVFLASAGGISGVALAWGCSALISALVPALPFETPPWLVVLAVSTSGIIGLLSGIVPAYRAAHVDPVEALRVQ